MKEQHQMIKWVKAHKKQLTLAGIGVATLIAVVLAIKNKDTLIELWTSLKETVEPTTDIILEAETPTEVDIPEEASSLLMSKDPCVLQEISRHIRNLHEGWEASPEKIALAREMGIILEEGQTWVESYVKGSCAA